MLSPILGVPAFKWDRERRPYLYPSLSNKIKVAYLERRQKTGEELFKREKFFSFGGNECYYWYSLQNQESSPVVFLNPHFLYFADFSF